MNRKKELKEVYKNMKPDMGVFIIKNSISNNFCIEATEDLNAAINGSKFRLGFGNYPNKELQKEWEEYGKESFTIEILENLEYDKDGLKIDYSEDLEILKMIWEEKLSIKDVRNT